jgi:hypothetical protein
MVRVHRVRFPARYISPIARREMIYVVTKENMNVSELVVTGLVLYDGKLLVENKVFDWSATLVEGAVAPHHLMRLKVLLENHEMLKYNDEIHRDLTPEQVVEDALNAWGYRVIKKSIICNIDYTEEVT